VVGKPVGTVGSAWLLARLSGGRIRPPVGWASVTGAGTIAGIGLVVSLLIASLAFHGEQLAQAKLGVLSGALCASVLTWIVFRVTALLPKPLRLRLLLGSAETIVDLVAPVDPHRDHVRGPAKAPVTVVEYGDFECPYCGQAEPAIRELLADYGDVRYVWRHLPLTDVHPHAQLAAEGAEAAAKQGRFWEMHDQLLSHQGALTEEDLIGYARDLGLAAGRFADDLARHAGSAKIAEDVDSADLSRVSGTPTFFSTAGATTGPTTSARSPTRCAPPGPGWRSDRSSRPGARRLPLPGPGRRPGTAGCETETVRPGQEDDHDWFGRRGRGGHHRDRRRPGGAPDGLRRDADHRQRRLG